MLQLYDVDRLNEYILEAVTGQLFLLCPALRVGRAAGFINWPSSLKEPSAIYVDESVWVDVSTGD